MGGLSSTHSSQTGARRYLFKRDKDGFPVGIDWELYAARREAECEREKEKMLKGLSSNR